MIDGKTVLAVIPARSGSKRCPGKNFREFRGKPLYQWSIEHAQGSRLIDRIIFSTDEDRTPELCTDEAKSEDVIRFHLQTWPADYVVLLQPTSPLRTSADIDYCILLCHEWGQPVVTSREDWSKNGAVYVASSEWIAKNNFSEKTVMYQMPDDRSLDIDYEYQFAA